MDVKMYSPAGDRLADVTKVLALTTEGAAHAAVEHVVAQVAADREFDTPVMIVVVEDGSGVDDVFEAFSSTSVCDGETYVGTIVSKLGHGVAGTMYLI